MPWRNSSQPNTWEKVCGGLSYFTFGISGLLYILISKSSNQSMLFKTHMYQAVLLSILATLVGWCVGPVVGIVTNLIGAASKDAALGILSGFSIVAGVVTIAYTGLLIYGAVFAFLGKFAEIPLISRMVRENMR